MAALQQTLADMCPSSFGGPTGGLFATAVATVVAAHCAIFDDYQWPKDCAEDILRSDVVADYDFIVVGAGSAGSLVASRLASARPSWSVLLIEAGDDPGLDSEVPGLLLRTIDSDYDWLHRTQPDNRSCLGFKSHSCIWTKGKGLGGSSSINAMLYVRGHPNDFNKWAELGADGWNYEELRPYFENLEIELGLNNFQQHDHPWHAMFSEAWNDIGLSAVKETNEAVVGTKVAKLLIKDGKRLNTAKHFLKTFKNLSVMKNTRVQKVIIDSKSKIATGVKIKHKSGIIMEITARKEVILSEGSIGTPQTLMLSGIGPKQHLEELKIDCLLNLPVGKYLQDHAILHLFFKSNISTVLTQEVINFFLLQYALTKTGPFSTIGTFEFLTFIDTNHTNYPDLQFYHSHYTTDDKILLERNLKRMGYKKPIVDAILEENKHNDIFIIHPSALHPKSRGEILLQDNNPDSTVIINANYFSHPDDVKIYIKAIDLVKKLEVTDTFERLGMELIHLKIDSCSGLLEERYWECYLRHIANTVYHPVGTAKMGAENYSVVDAHLKVHGIKQLRVVDASVMPEITGGNTLAPTLVIAEKAADLILREYSIKDEL